MNARVLSTEISETLAEEVDLLARRLERSPQWIVEQALGAFINREALQRELTLEGMADVDAGRFVGQADIDAWVEGLAPGSKPD